MIEVRTLKAEDAEQYLTLLNKLDKETIFRLYEPGENKITVDEQIKQIKEMEKSINTVVFVAEEDGMLVGYLGAYGRVQNRIKHTVTVAIAILQSHVGKGIGTLFFEELDMWAKKNGKHRIELTVMDNNVAGQALYKKAGFEVEGVKRDSLLVNGEYINDIYMSKLI